jgi:hypothetical protein
MHTMMFLVFTLWLILCREDAGMAEMEVVSIPSLSRQLWFFSCNAKCYGVDNSTLSHGD